MSKIYSVYVLRSLSGGKHYVGMATDVVARLKEHNRGKSRFTKGHIPWELLYAEEVGAAALARKREKYLKSAAVKKYLK
jgi:putative endonuclease